MASSIPKGHHGLAAVDTKGAPSKQPAVRLYLYPGSETRVLHLLSIGFKKTQTQDFQIRRGAGRFFSEYMANVVVLFADSVRRLGGKGRLRTEHQYEIVSKVFDSTVKLLEDSGSLTPVVESASEPGITICTPVEAAESEARDPVPVPRGPRSNLAVHA